MGETARVTGVAEQARAAFDRRAWAEAYALLTDACAGDHADATALERLAVAAYCVGDDAASERAWQRAHAEWLRVGDLSRAARAAFWLGLTMLLRGDGAPGGGWLARCARLSADLEPDDVAHGYLLVPAALEALRSGEAAVSYDHSVRCAGLAERHGDGDLRALGCLGQAQASLALGDTTRGVALLDEIMVAVTAGEVSVVPAGIVYCAVIASCLDVFDLRRAAEWTAALHRWCAAQPDLVPFRGQCLVHRSQILQAHGAWPEAVAEAGRACEYLARPAHPALGLALYQRGELHRLRGELAAADAAYRAASEHGLDPVLGVALLRLAEGDVAAAAAAVQRALDAGHERPRALAAYVEIELAAGDVPAARAGADELAATAVGSGAPLLEAMAAQARGAVLLADGDTRAALAVLRDACDRWHALDVPYEAARVRVLIGLACRSLDDHAGCDVHLDAARAVFDRLGAAPDLARVTAASDAARPARGVLTERECEVLRLVAAGLTNRAIAAELGISEHTVGRHLQNIFAKAGLPSRAAATAYAYEQGLV